MAKYDASIRQEYNDIGVEASATITDGDALSYDATHGYLHRLVATEGFAGFARRDLVAAATNGEDSIKTIQRGARELTVVGASAATDVGSTVYASDHNTFTLTSTGNTAIGKVHRWVSGTTCIVFFEATSIQSL